MHPLPEQDLGPPKMRSPGGKPGQRKVSVDWTTTNPYTRAAQSSSDLLRLACAASQCGGGLSEWICGHVASRKETTCR